MRSKGYDGRIEVDEASGMLCGSVPGLRDVITFQGRTVEEARRSFEESIDFYLKICDGQGRRPDVPYSGRLVIRPPRRSIACSPNGRATRARASTP